MEVHEEFCRVACFAVRAVLVGDHRFCCIAAGPVEPHIALGLSRLSRLFQHLERCLVRMKYRLLHKPSVHLYVDRRQLIIRSPENPIGHSLLGKLDVGTVQALFLLVQRRCHHKLLYHNMSNDLRRDIAAGDHWRDLFRFRGGVSNISILHFWQA